MSNPNERVRARTSASAGSFSVIQPPAGVGNFHFVVLSMLRAAQLIRGCLPKVEGKHKPTVIAQFEVAEGKITSLIGPHATPPEKVGRRVEEVAVPV